MVFSRLPTPIALALGAVLGAAGVVATILLCGVLFRFDSAVGPIVIRSQAGSSYALPVPEVGHFSCQSEGSAAVLPAEVERPVNVVLVVGDGMGLGTVSSVSALVYGPSGGLALEGAPVTGSMKTFASDALVTDSGASATAMATGRKTNRRMISVLPDGRSVPTLFEKAHSRGLRTGVVTTSGLMDATPAAFTAHNTNRKNYAEILAEQLGSGTDIMIGAAWGQLEGRDRKLNTAFAAARGRGVTIVTSSSQLEKATAPLVALFPPRRDSPDAGGPPLEVSVRKALSELGGSPSGFLLVVEAEETDETAHDNDVRATVAAMVELDAALREILRFAEKRNDTLVIVTADHDTGGMALVRGRAAEGRATVRWVSDNHTATWAPVFAFGPGAEVFAGVFDNTDIFTRIVALLNL